VSAPSKHQPRGEATTPTRPSQPLKAVSFLFRWQRQPEHRNHALSRYVHFLFYGIGQVQGLTMLAAINFGVRPPGFFHVTTGLFEHVDPVRPALQMAAAEFAFFILLVAGALPGLLDLYFVTRKLRRSLGVGSGDFASRQRLTSLRLKPAAGFGLTSAIVLEDERRTQAIEAEAAMSYARAVRLRTGIYCRVSAL
jgi:hypothetical protein